MKILFCGATGFIGRHVLSVLLRDGHEIVALTRDASAARQQKRIPEAVTLFQGDLALRSDWMMAVDGCDCVINLAGEQAVGKRWTHEREKQIRDSRIASTENLVEAIDRAQSRPKTLINASASGYYGDNPSEQITEDAPAGHDTLAKLCLEWENAALKANSLGVRVIIIRLGVVLHESGGVLKELIPIYKLGVGGPLGNGKQGFPWIHREDVGAIIQFLLADDSIEGPVNVVAPEAISNKQFSRMLGKLLKRPALLPVPAFILRTLYGKGADGLLHGSRPVPSRLAAAGYKFHYPTLRMALEEALKVTPSR